jgi:CheY-like chemotaxis protein
MQRAGINVHVVPEVAWPAVSEEIVCVTARTLSKLQAAHKLPLGSHRVLLLGHDEAQLQAARAVVKAAVVGTLVQPCTGTMFCKALDALVQPPLQPPAAPSRSTRLQSVRLLLAEDNEINQLVAQELLEGEGAFVTVAADGKCAVDLIQAAPDAYDAVLMDLLMPVMDGLEAARSIRAMGCSKPIIALSANASEADRLSCLAAGMDDHVGKPFDLEVLVRVLRHHVSAVPEAHCTAG